MTYDESFLLLAPCWQQSVPVIIELTNFSENLREHEFGYWVHRLRRCPVFSTYQANLRNKACDGGHRHIPHLSLTGKRPWNITSDCRPRDNVEHAKQRCKKMARYLCPA